MNFKMIHQNFNVLDLDRSIAFYEKALGLKEHRRKAGDDGAYVIVYMGNRHSDFELELTWVKEMDRPYDLGDEEFHLAFSVDDYDEAYALHEEMGCVAFVNEEMGLYFITDPDGYWIEILPNQKNARKPRSAVKVKHTPLDRPERVNKVIKKGVHAVKVAAPKVAVTAKKLANDPRVKKAAGTAAFAAAETAKTAIKNPKVKKVVNAVLKSLK